MADGVQQITATHAAKNAMVERSLQSCSSPFTGAGPSTAAQPRFSRVARNENYHKLNERAFSTYFASSPRHACSAPVGVFADLRIFPDMPHV